MPNHHPKLTLTAQFAGLPGAGTPVPALPGKSGLPSTSGPASTPDVHRAGLLLADALQSFTDEIELPYAAKWAGDAAASAKLKGAKTWTSKATAAILQAANTGGYVVSRHRVNAEGSSVYLTLDHPTRASWIVRVSDHPPVKGDWSEVQSCKRKLISVQRARALSHFVCVLLKRSPSDAPSVISRPGPGVPAINE